jgi:peptidoglycan/xylan/chitin deacetylase (PgdA/CDA1 family)
MEYQADQGGAPVEHSLGELGSGGPSEPAAARPGAPRPGADGISAGQQAALAQPSAPAVRATDGSGPAVRRACARPRAPFVLMYHSITAYTEDPYLVTVSPQRFERQMRWLHHRGLRGVSIGTLMAARLRNCDAGLVGLTFDDGYDDFVRYALPVLLRYGFTATAFIIAGRLGGQNGWDEQGPRKQLMTARQVREVAAAGMEIGSHGLRHIALTETTDLALRREQAHSRQILQDLTGTEVAGFCYPYGTLDRRVLDGVGEAGYEYGCAIWASQLTSRYALPRVYVGEPDGAARLGVKRLRHLLTSAAMPHDTDRALAGAQPVLRRSA